MKKNEEKNSSQEQAEQVQMETFSEKPTRQRKERSEACWLSAFFFPET